jgi:hypothetical protein
MSARAAGCGGAGAGRARERLGIRVARFHQDRRRVLENPSAMSVFVSIASYSDPVLGFTLQRALATASRPQALHFGICDQCPAQWPRPRPDVLAPARMSYVRLDPVDARGPCWARAISMSLYAGEDWFFQIDSHMDFDTGWDERLIAQARRLLPGRPGVVLSAYPNAFVIEGNQAIRKPTTDKVLAHVVKPATTFAPDHPVLSFEAHPVDTEQAVPGFHLGAGCLFANGAFAEVFPYDPHLYFHGEEQALAARLFSHGWDIFHVPGLPVYHLYNTGASGAPPRPMHWDESQQAGRSVNWWTLEQRSRARLGDLVSGRLQGAYGLGRVRSMADYAAFCGIDYAAGTLSDQAFRPLPARV